MLMDTSVETGVSKESMLEVSDEHSSTSSGLLGEGEERLISFSAYVFFRGCFCRLTELLRLDNVQ